ncbi:SDR family NAD(P)-dependent oxidoreductase [Streptomyces iranensis]|uniref:SDR family NAD(P)-dependent oxidoreductase n=1 Tax=Streptomyces iranensis TaxID=576784 RepID=UPI0039B7333A
MSKIFLITGVSGGLGRAFAQEALAAGHRVVVDRIECGISPIDVLISNAGYGVEGTAEESSMDDPRRQFDVNVYGTVAAIRAVLPYLRRRRGGHIVTLSSMAGLTALPARPRTATGPAPGPRRQGPPGRAGRRGRVACRPRRRR